MSIEIGDLLIDKHTNVKYIAISADFTCRVAGTGEYVDDWRFIPAVKVINPMTGYKYNVYLRDVKKLTGTCQI